jgi:hypothetical protein
MWRGASCVWSPSVRKPIFDRGQGIFPVGGGKQRGFWLYALGLNGVVKIGYSKTPRSRILNHLRQHEGAVEWVHLFARLGTEREARMAEKRAIEIAAQHSERIRETELFRGLTRDVCLSAVRSAMDVGRAA